MKAAALLVLAFLAVPSTALATGGCLGSGQLCVDVTASPGTATGGDLVQAGVVTSSTVAPQLGTSNSVECGPYAQQGALEPDVYGVGCDTSRTPAAIVGVGIRDSPGDPLPCFGHNVYLESWTDTNGCYLVTVEGNCVVWYVWSDGAPAPSIVLASACA